LQLHLINSFFRIARTRRLNAKDFSNITHNHPGIFASRSSDRERRASGKTPRVTEFHPRRTSPRLFDGSLDDGLTFARSVEDHTSAPDEAIGSSRVFWLHGTFAADHVQSTTSPTPVALQ
jgi:hypothetical protein